MFNMSLLFLSLTSRNLIHCSGNHTYHAKGTGYYPSNDPIEGGYVDERGNPLQTLQDVLDGKYRWASVAMDKYLNIKYGTSVCIPEINKKYQRVIPFKVVDTGSAFFHKGYSRIDICTRSKQYSWDKTINGQLTLIFT